jgi:hypothetical protein
MTKLRHAIYFFPDAERLGEFVAACVCGWSAEKPTLFLAQAAAIEHDADAAVGAIKRIVGTTYKNRSTTT